MALSDVRRELTFCRKTGTPVLGLIENMSGFVCPHCSVSLLNGPCPSKLCPLLQECTNIFSTGGGESLAELCKVPFLGNVKLGYASDDPLPFFFPGRIPLDPRLTQCLEEGKSYVDAYIGAPAQTAMADIVKKLLNQTESKDSDVTKTGVVPS